MLKTSLSKQDILSLISFYDSFSFTPKALTTSDFLDLLKLFNSLISLDSSKVFFTSSSNSINYLYEYLSPDQQTYKRFSVNFTFKSSLLGFNIDLSVHNLPSGYHRLVLNLFIFYQNGIYYLDKYISEDTQDIFNYDFTIPLNLNFNFDDYYAIVKPNVLSQGSNIDSVVKTFYHDVNKGTLFTTNNVVFTDYLVSKVCFKKGLYYLSNGQLECAGYWYSNFLASLVFNSQISGSIDSDGSRFLSLKTCNIYQAIEIIGALQADQDYLEEIRDVEEGWLDPGYNYDCPTFEIDCEDCSQIEDLFKNVYSSLGFLASLIKTNQNEGDDEMDYTAQLTAINNSLQAIHSDLNTTVEVEEGQTQEINITQAVVNVSEEKDPLPIVISEGVSGLKAIPFDKINNI